MRRGRFFSWVAGGFEGGEAAAMREVTAEKLDRRVVVLVGEGGVTAMTSVILFS